MGVAILARQKYNATTFGRGGGGWRDFEPSHMDNKLADHYPQAAENTASCFEILKQNPPN